MKDEAKIPDHLYKLKIDSKNNFPTSAGLASSASGYGALSFGLWKIFKLENKVSMRKLSQITRLGSGSACRSLFGGFVIWHCGNGIEEECFAESLILPTELFLPSQNILASISCLIFIFSEKKKKIASSLGMKISKETSPFFNYRLSSIIPSHLNQLEIALKNQDVATIFNVIMKDSDSFHGVCATSFPPIFYLNESSHLLIESVHQFNKIQGKITAAYSFDAGPNAFIFLLQEDISKFLHFLSNNPEYCQLVAKNRPIHTKIGCGPTFNIIGQ